MAATPILRTYLQRVIGLGDNPEGIDRANAFIAQGISSLEDLAEFESNDDVKTLCATVRKPGGTIEDPVQVAANAAAVAAGNAIPHAQVRQIPDPGHMVPNMCELRLMLAVFGARYYTALGRPVEEQMLSRAILNKFRAHISAVSNHQDPDDLPEIGRSYGIMKFLDQFPVYLREVLGVNKVPLVYIIRDADPPATLPALAPHSPWSVDMTGIMDELIAHTPHSGPNYDADNARVFGMLSHALGATQHMASITRYQSKRDGRKAFLALMQHNMGSNKFEKMIQLAEDVIQKRVYNGKNPRLTLKTHIDRHRAAYNDLVRAKEHISYEPMNEDTRVRYLLASITAKELAAAKAVIVADPAKKGDFETAADYLLIMDPVHKPTDNTHRISAIKRGTDSLKAEDRFYTREEWKKLSAEQQKKVQELRAKRKKSRKVKGKEQDQSVAAITALQEQVNIIAKVLTDDKKIKLPPMPKHPPLQPPPGYANNDEV